MMNQKINQLIAAAESLLHSDIPKSAKHKCLEIELAMRITDLKSEPVNEDLDRLTFTIKSNFQDSREDLETIRAIVNGLMWSEETHDAVRELGNFIDQDINQSWNELPNQSKQKQIEQAF